MPAAVDGCGHRGQVLETDRAATALVDALAKEDYAAAGKDFDDVMRKAMPADKRKETWQAVVKQVGAFQKRIGTVASKKPASTMW